MNSELPEKELLLASTINFLIEGQEFYEASLLLLLCADIEVQVSESYRESTALIIVILGSRAIYEIIHGDDKHVKETIKQAFNAVLPLDMHVDFITSRVQLVEIDSQWRLKLSQSKKALNQGIPIKDSTRFPWENLYFRSPHEIAIAKELNEHEVFFLPNCMARFGSAIPSNRKNREADFLVCYDGKWGIIEVDGEINHRAAEDHDRDRLFRSHRIRVIERFTAKQCTNEPKKVVREFLDLLNKNG